MIPPRKLNTMISLSLLSLLVLSVVPIYSSCTTTTSASAQAGDVLQYSVASFNVDFTPFNEIEDNPFEIDDPTILEGSVLYFKILRERFNKVTYAVGFILGKEAQVRLDKHIEWPSEIDPVQLPDYVELPVGAGVPFFAGEYDMDHPFPRDWDPSELPMIINPNIDWNRLRDELVEKWRPNRAAWDKGANTLIATWQHALASTEEGVSEATLVWDKNKDGALTRAVIKGQQIVGGDVSKIDIEVLFWKKEHIGLPAEVNVGYSPEYILTDAFFDQQGIDRIAGQDLVAEVQDMIDTREGNTVLQIEITELDGLFYEFNTTFFPGDFEFEKDPELSEGLAFGLGLPFLTPDWEFYTSVWATGNLLTGTYLDVVAAIKPAAIPNLDLGDLLLNLKVAVEGGYHYFGFIFGEEASSYDSEADLTINTASRGEGWLAYEDSGLFAGLYLKIFGEVWTDGVPAEQGGDFSMNGEFTAKVDRKDLADGDGVPHPSRLEPPQFTPPPPPEQFTPAETKITITEEPLKTTETKEPAPEPTETGSPAFIPGFELITTVVGLLGLSVIVVRKRKVD